MVMQKNALIVWGGWDGHRPQQVAELFRELLGAEGFGVRVETSLNAFDDLEALKQLHLIVPVWTMGKLERQQQANVCEAVRSAGVGIAGAHGGMCDAFRDATEWQFMTGGQWVAHPGNSEVTYTVRIADRGHPITAGVEDYPVRTEQYYMHVDPAVRVLATTRFPIADGPHVPNGAVEMPVMWTKLYGVGRVFYHSVGHTEAELAAEPTRTLMRRGFQWAARA